MKIRVEKVQLEKEGIVVCCRTSIGGFKGIWTQKEEPLIGEEYHAELSIEEYANRIEVSPLQDYSVSMKDNLIDLADGIRAEDDFVRFSADYRKIKIYPYEL